ncbi:MAG: hypothetical protein WCT77_08995, partial [Bacteroidota bacterium]
ENSSKLKAWKEHIIEHWADVEIINTGTENNGTSYVGKSIKIHSQVSLGKLSPEDVVVQVYYGSVNHLGEFQNTNFQNLNLIKSEGSVHFYDGEYICQDTGMQGFTVRIIPSHPFLVNLADMRLCKWA